MLEKIIKNEASSKLKLALKDETQIVVILISNIDIK